MNAWRARMETVKLYATRVVEAVILLILFPLNLGKVFDDAKSDDLP